MLYLINPRPAVAPISDSLAKIINSKLADGLDIMKLKEILSKYQRPKNYVSK